MMKAYLSVFVVIMTVDFLVTGVASEKVEDKTHSQPYQKITTLVAANEFSDTFVAYKADPPYMHEDGVGYLYIEQDPTWTCVQGAWSAPEQDVCVISKFMLRERHSSLSTFNAVKLTQADLYIRRLTVEELRIMKQDLEEGKKTFDYGEGLGRNKILLEKLTEKIKASEQVDKLAEKMETVGLVTSDR